MFRYRMAIQSVKQHLNSKEDFITIIARNDSDMDKKVSDIFKAMNGDIDSMSAYIMYSARTIKREEIQSTS